MTAFDFPDLVGHKIKLTRLNPEADAEELYAASHGENALVWKYLLSPPFPSVEEYKKYLHSFAPDIASYTVVDIKSGAKIGVVNYINIVPEHKRLELGNIWYTPKFHKTYANTESIYLMLRHAFVTLKLRRVEWKCHNENEPSKKAALGLGFKYEGLFRKHMIVKGENRDTAWFSIIDDEWEGVEKALQAKLSTQRPVF
eukprot:Phypoly_transcript_19058.p1 GENE.Phypoly_transcript_19058~~Phypoly_transcript_19058.p1  ORF type:complete len:199 (+),score=28.80 Phypoly_transcript_19058:132-728(+)